MARDDKPSRGLPVRREEPGFLRPWQEDWWTASPFAALRRMQEEMDRWFGGGLSGFGGGYAPEASGAMGARQWAPHVDMLEENDQIVVRADIPGVEPEDLELYCTDDALIVRGEARSSDEREERGYHRRERRYGRFERVLSLPAEVDREKIQASFRNGVLEVRMPRTESSRPQMQRIPIQGSRPMTGAKGGEAGGQASAQTGTAPSGTQPEGKTEQQTSGGGAAGSAASQPKQKS